MEHQFKTSLPQTQFDSTVEETIAQYSKQSHLKILSFSPIEFWNTIKRLPYRKSLDSDGIPNCALKYSDPKTILHLYQILNGCIRLGYFSKPWKQAHIIMLQKPEDSPLQPSNYRPISLLNTLSKLYEELLLNRLNNQNIQIPPWATRLQTKAQYYNSTFQTYWRTLYQWQQKENIFVVSLDFEKAFDKVWHPGLLYKLIQMEIPDQFIKLMKSFLTNRSFQIKIKNTLSKPKPIKTDIPQGSYLSPHLFFL